MRAHERVRVVGARAAAQPEQQAERDREAQPVEPRVVAQPRQVVDGRDRLARDRVEARRRLVPQVAVRLALRVEHRRDHGKE